MTALIRAIFEFLWMILVRWIVALPGMIQWLVARCRAAMDRARLPGRQARGADSNCVPIRHPSFRKPDPLIYSQSYLMQLGLAVTWDNPDIELRRGGVAVRSSAIDPDADYEIVARIWNASTNAPVVGLPVVFSYLDFGMGGVSRKIGATKVDLGVKGGPGCPAFATMPWHTPATPGHYCIQVQFAWIDDANPLNNLGQENLVIGRAHSPANLAFTLRNAGDERHVFRFEVDAYELPAPGPCDAIRRPSRRELLRRSVEPAAARLFPPLAEGVRRLHDRAAYPVPEGWTVAFDPAEVALVAGADRTVRVSIEAPSGFRGLKRFNVRAVDGNHIAGGITLVVEAG